MFTIKPNTTPSMIRTAFKKQDAEQLRESEQRRSYLEKLAAMNAGQDVYVQISGQEAYADIAKRDSRMGYTDRVIINVPAEIPNQPATNYDEEVWDLLFQKTELYHELGHVLYTDWPSFEDMLFGDQGQWGVESEHRAMFKGWWNTIEDAAIERLLATRFNIKNDLRVKNENLLRSNHPSKHGALCSLGEAVSISLMQYKHPIGWVNTLLDEGDDELQFLTDDDREVFEDEIHPIIEDMVPDIIDEGDPVERNRMVYALYEQIEPFIDSSPTGGQDKAMNFGFADDGEDRGDGSEGKSVDTPDEEPEMEAPEMGGMRSIDLDAQQMYEDEVSQQKKDLDDEPDDVAEMEAWARCIEHEYKDGTSLSLQVPQDPRGSFDDATRTEAERLSNPLAKELRQRLRQEQRSKKKSGQRSGKVDSTNIHKTKQGKTNVFKQTVDPEDKDYNAMVIVDRSGSMDGYNYNLMPETEQSAGAVAYALEEVGVDVGVMSFSAGNIFLEKSFADTVDESKEKIFRGYNSGGTPLSDALALARARLKDRGGHSFVVVITDGEPDHRERYRDELHKCDFPVLGVYINQDGEFNEGHMNENAYFHALEMRKYDESFDGLRNLVKQVMF